MEKNDCNPDGWLTANFEPEAVVVGGGDTPNHPLMRKWLEHHPRLVCCDGTANQWQDSWQEPWQIVGDGDSIAPAVHEKYKDIITIYPEQETNDQTKAIHFIHEKAPDIRRIAIIGGTGRREDHTLGNISLLLEYQKLGLEVRMYTNHGVFIPCCDTTTLHCPKDTAVSIFNFTATHLSSEKLAYPIYDFTNWWQGTLNQTLADDFTIHAQGCYLVYLAYSNQKERE